MPKKAHKKADHLALLRKRIAKAPTNPGVYRWLDEDGDVLYVGKAKNLRNRLKSYVEKTMAKTMGPWKIALMERVRDFSCTITNTELEALILETNLIKECKPKYNVLMKDDKNYVYVRVAIQDPFPSVEIVRRMADDKAKYFGPYTSAFDVRETLTMLRKIFPFRNCKMSIEAAEKNGQRAAKSPSPKSQVLIPIIVTHRDRPTPCLDHHIHQCSAPCIGTVTPEEYRAQSISGVINFLKGDDRALNELILQRMQEAAAEKKYEQAAKIRDVLTRMKAMQEKQLISDTSGEDADVIGLASGHGRTQIVLLAQRGGKVISEKDFPLLGLAESAADALAHFLTQYYSQTTDIPPVIAIGEELPEHALLEEWLRKMRGAAMELRIAQRGKKSHLLSLAERNALEKMRAQETKWEVQAENTALALKELAELLALKIPPKRIEGYDISHLSGTETVGSMAVAKDGKSASDLYRSFTIRTMKEGEIDDYRALKEVLGRRLRHLADSVREEEKIWNEKGIIVRRGKNSDRKALEKFLTPHADEVDTSDVNPKEFVVVERKKKIVGSGRIRKTEKALELGTVFVDERLRGKHLGQCIIRHLLKGVKTGKVYLETKAELEDYYAAIGFRTVRTAPNSILEKAKRAQKFFKNIEVICMMWEASKNKTDPSLSMRPDLLVIDGGKGQLSAALEILKDAKLAIPVIGLAKREEEVFVPGSTEPVIFPKDSQAKFLLMRLRDEAHRFANRHREKRVRKRMIA
ncbi:MAG: GNAT family N-acetyltransferase [Candidatus Peribacteraceae bacterium]|nr:GNAT family N-acetyltransferase [Candidatus Peribacteraceae bacterium]